MYLLDTNVIIDFLNDKLPKNANDLFKKIDQPKISVITRIELFATNKILRNEYLAINGFVEIATVYNSLTIEIIDQTINLRKKQKIKLPDAIIAATALVYDLILISRNSSDFKNIEELQVINPYNL